MRGRRHPSEVPSEAVSVPPLSNRLRPVAVDVVVDDLTLRITRPPSAEDLIDEEAYAVDERLPYWAELWPSARVLARALASASLAGRTVLELGCGLGLPSIVALARGATLLATDWYDEALAFASANAREALGRDLDTMLVDWRDPPDALLQRAPFDLVVAADVLYEERNAEALATLLPRVVSRAGEVWIADPRRPHANHLWPRLEGRGWSRATEAVRVEGATDEAGPVVHLHRLRPGPGPEAQDRASESDTLGRSNGPR